MSNCVGTKIFAYSTVMIITQLAAFALSVQAQKIPPGNPPGMYDESKIPEYNLPDPLIMMDGRRVTDTAVWNEERRPEILNLFEKNVYGKAMIGRPKGMHWEVKSEGQTVLNGSAIAKSVTIYFSEKNLWPKLDVNIVLPKAGKPVPVFLVSTWFPGARILVERGFGLVTYDAREIEPDDEDSAYDKGIRKFFDPSDQQEPTSEEWGTIAAWSWTARRVMDYLETDSAIDARRVCILGFSRFGKAAMWAGAQDQRFAIVFSCESGCGGATIVRRGFGETVKLINHQFPHWFDGEFKKYNDRANDLPVDWHMLIALMAPRPVYLSTAEEDLWGDPRGTFVAAKDAEPVYRLFGEEGLGVTEMPPVERQVGNFIGYHMRKGKHGLTDYDMERYLDFAEIHFGMNSQK
jgi:hypothetical protein